MGGSGDKNNVTYQRYYYYHDNDAAPADGGEDSAYDKNKKKKNFEQSLDVYTTSSSSSSSSLEDDDNDQDHVVVLLVVGSCWMGHCSLVYGPTSWWNSSGPQTLVKSSGNVTCVCIRHRGAFFSHWFVDKSTLVIGTIGCLFTAYYGCCWKFYPQILSMLLVLTIFLLMWYFGLRYLRRDVATFDDMIQDVSTAIHFCHRNQDTLFSSGKQRRHYVLGGYSSGGHVMASLLQLQLQQKRHEQQHEALLPRDMEISGVLYLSGVLSVRNNSGRPSPVVTAAKTTTNGTDCTTTTPSSSSKTSKRLPSAKSNTQSTTWLTDFIMKSVWDNPEQIPSPLHDSLMLEGCDSSNSNQMSDLPHLFISCKYELFGFHFLDPFFASSEYYTQLLQLQQTPARRTLRILDDCWNCNHWTVLSSHQLRNVLEEELETLVLGTTTNKEEEYTPPPPVVMAAANNDKEELSQAAERPTITIRTPSRWSSMATTTVSSSSLHSSASESTTSLMANDD